MLAYMDRLIPNTSVSIQHFNSSAQLKQFFVIENNHTEIVWLSLESKLSWLLYTVILGSDWKGYNAGLMLKLVTDLGCCLLLAQNGILMM